MNLPNQKGFSPIFIIIGVVVLLVIGFLGYNLKSKEQSKPAYSNVQIMYGYSDYDEYLKNRPDNIKKADENLINFVMNSGEVKTRAEGAQRACDTGFDYINKNDKETAIKRYNQAWLLDPNQPCVYAGYGYYLGSSPKTLEDSFKMYEKALSLSKPSSQNEHENSWWILVDYGEVLDRCYISDNKRSDCLDKALDNLTKSLVIKDTPKTHRALAIVYYHKKDYKESWNQVHLAISGGVPEKAFGQFLNDLKKVMPDPEGKIQ